MTVEELKTMRAIQIISREMQEKKINGCKVKIFNSHMCDGLENYENAINEFMANHQIVDVKPTQSDHMHSIHIFYKDK